MPSANSEPAPAPRRLGIHVVLFAVTIGTVFFTQIHTTDPTAPHPWRDAAQFTAALLAILLTHEFGHYFAARIHGVDASLPYFIPMPFPLSPFGTMGAVIRMRGTITSRKALLDIGASGPLAGLVVAIPLYVWGIAHSSLVHIGTGDYTELGESMMLKVLDRVAAPAQPAGMELLLSPIAYAAWAGMFVTMINLLPLAQLDGGHVAYALFGPRQDRIAITVHRALLAFFFVSLANYIARDLRAGFGLVRLGTHVGNSLFWLVSFEVLAILGTLSRPGPRPAPEPGEMTIRTRLLAIAGLITIATIGHSYSRPAVWIAFFVAVATLIAMEVRGGALRRHTMLDHPSTGEEPLGPGRKLVAILTLVMFILLFMPTPMAL